MGVPTERLLLTISLSTVALDTCQLKKKKKSHKACTSLAVEIILEPFDLLGFYENEGKILLFKPLSVTGTRGLGPAVVTDWLG